MANTHRRTKTANADGSKNGPATKNKRYARIEEIIEKKGGIEKVDGTPFAARLKLRRRRSIEVRGIIKNIGGFPQLLVPSGTKINKKVRHDSYGAGTRIIRVL